MSSKSRSAHLDSVLTGLAMFQAYTDRDHEAMSALTESVSPTEVTRSLLASMEILSGIFAAQLGIEASHVTSSVRRRIIRELVAEAHRTGPA